MKQLRKIIYILLGVDILGYIVIKVFDIQMTTAYGDCANNICTDSMRTNSGAVAAYAALGGLFVITVLLWVVFMILYVNARRKYRRQNKR
jgi:hypothetical protein